MSKMAGQGETHLLLLASPLACSKMLAKSCQSVGASLIPQVRVGITTTCCSTELFRGSAVAISCGIAVQKAGFCFKELVCARGPA